MEILESVFESFTKFIFCLVPDCLWPRYIQKWNMLEHMNELARQRQFRIDAAVLRFPDGVPEGSVSRPYPVESLVYFIDTAQTSIDIIMKTMDCVRIKRSLKRASIRGLTIRVLLDYNLAYTDRLMTSLLRAGIEVRYFLCVTKEHSFDCEFLLRDYAAGYGIAYVFMQTGTNGFGGPGFTISRGALKQQNDYFTDLWDSIM